MGGVTLIGTSWRFVSRQGALSLLLLFGCARGMKPEVPTQEPAAVLDMARARPIPDPLQGKFTIKVRSERLDIAGSTNGVIIVDRPGKGHIAILGPLGGPLFTLSSDGVGVSVVLPRDSRHLLALDAETVLEQAAPGLAELDDLFGLLLGDIPVDEARVREVKKLDEERVLVVLEGPDDTVIAVTLRSAVGTPEAIIVQRSTGERVLAATFATFTEVEGALMPSQVAVEVPSLDLRVDLAYRSWRLLDEVPPVFGLEAPPGFTTESLERAVQDMALGLADDTAAAE